MLIWVSSRDIFTQVFPVLIVISRTSLPGGVNVAYLYYRATVARWPLPLHDAVLRNSDMDIKVIEQKLNELRETVGKVSSSPVQETAVAGEYRPTPEAVPTSNEELLDYLRVFVNYIAFDLEATRRENKYLRHMLQTRYTEDKDEDSQPGEF